MSKWNEEMVAKLESLVGDESPVSQETVDSAAGELDVSNRSVAAKLRKMGYEVAKVAERAKTFTDEESDALAAFVEANSGNYTFAEIAQEFAGGKFTPRQIQGKVLSLELNSHVAPTPAKVAERKFSDEEETLYAKLANSGAFLEDIAEALGRTVNEVRGKALSMLKEGLITVYPKLRDKVEKVDPLTALGNDIETMTVAEIAEAIGKSERGVKTMITHRGLVCADYKSKKLKATA